MHTALRLGVIVAERIRALNPTAHICFYGLYAALNADELLATGADSVLAGEVETELRCELVRRLESGLQSRPAAPAPRADARASSTSRCRRAHALPSLKKYAHLERDGRRELAAYVEASRGCKHHCRHCPIPPVYGGRFFVVPVETVLADVRQQVAAGASHVTFGDPDFLNGPRHALAVARALHAEFPRVTFDFTAKVEHLLRAARSTCRSWPRSAARSSSRPPSRSTTRCSAHLDKGHTRADIVEALRAARAAGIALRPDLGGLHAVDHARRLPRVARLPGRRGRWSTTSIPSSTASAC